MKWHILDNRNFNHYNYSMHIPTIKFDKEAWGRWYAKSSTWSAVGCKPAFSICSTDFAIIAFKIFRSSCLYVVTNPSENCVLNLPALPPICNAWEVDKVSISFSPFSLTTGFVIE